MGAIRSYTRSAWIRNGLETPGQITCEAGWREGVRLICLATEPIFFQKDFSERWRIPMEPTGPLCPPGARGGRMWRTSLRVAVELTGL